MKLKSQHLQDKPEKIPPIGDKPKVSDWKKEFNKRIVSNDHNPGNKDFYKNIESFISQEIHTAQIDILDKLWNHPDIDKVFLEGVGARNLRVILANLKQELEKENV